MIAGPRAPIFRVLLAGGGRAPRGHLSSLLLSFSDRPAYFIRPIGESSVWSDHRSAILASHRRSSHSRRVFSASSRNARLLLTSPPLRWRRWSRHALSAACVNALRLLTPLRRRRSRPPCAIAGSDGGRIREEAAAVCVTGLRLRSARGLAGEPAAEALPGLEKAETSGQTGSDAEKAGPGLSLLLWAPDGLSVATFLARTGPLA